MSAKGAPGARRASDALKPPGPATPSSGPILRANRIAEFDFTGGSPVTLREYIWLHDELVGVILNETTLQMIRTNHIGRPVFAANVAGSPVWGITYRPFGGAESYSGTPIDLGFPGQWFQAESGLYQNWMRDYDPTTGSYIQPDPLGLIDGPAVYRYAMASPMAYSDPTGEGSVYNRSDETITLIDPQTGETRDLGPGPNSSVSGLLGKVLDKLELNTPLFPDWDYIWDGCVCTKIGRGIRYFGPMDPRDRGGFNAGPGTGEIVNPEWCKSVIQGSWVNLRISYKKITVEIRLHLFSIMFNFHLIFVLFLYIKRRKIFLKFSYYIAILFFLLHMICATIPMYIDGVFFHHNPAQIFPAGGVGSTFEYLGPLKYFSASAGFSPLFSISIFVIIFYIRTISTKKFNKYVIYILYIYSIISTSLFLEYSKIVAILT